MKEWHGMEKMYEVFNMGHRMELYVAPELAEEIIAISESFGVPAQVVGRVEAGADKELTLVVISELLNTANNAR